ncbi:MAG: sigma-70 family RNA polymerase sigma factor [Chloroflexota bacterium]|nr:sigma-70 family RNA polymerase sigma factor [Chloroflexota bacterium]
MINERSVVGLAADRASAFATLAAQHLEGSYRLAGLILRDETEAQDATHDAFVIAWRSWSTLRDPGRFEAWFGRILVNVCRDRIRRRQRRMVTDISRDLPSASGDFVTPIANRELLARAFVRLTPDHRIVVVLRFYLDLSIDQIADRVGVPSGTVKSRLHHAVRELGLALAANEDGEPAR